MENYQSSNKIGNDRVYDNNIEHNKTFKKRRLNNTFSTEKKQLIECCKCHVQLPKENLIQHVCDQDENIIVIDDDEIEIKEEIKTESEYFTDADLNQNYNIQCSNCNTIFTQTDFKKHICEFDGNSNFIEDENDEKEKKIKDGLKTEPEYFTDTDLNQFDNISIQCYNCNIIFTQTDFKKHACEFDGNSNFIEDENNAKEKKIKDEIETIPDHPLNVKLEENCKLIQQIFQRFQNNSSDVNKKKNLNLCTVCNRKFVHASGLKRHLEKHALDPISVEANKSIENMQRTIVYKCLICGQILFFGIDTVQHMTCAHPEIVFNDDFEDRYIANVANPGAYDPNPKMLSKRDHYEMRYYDIIAIDSILQCEFCDMNFSDVYFLLQHEVTHDPSFGFECSSCKINVLTFKDIYFHWKTECKNSKIDALHGLDKYYVCNVCEYQFTTLESLLIHRYTDFHLFPRYNVNENVVKTNCEYCGELHLTAAEAILHYVEIHKKKTKNDVPNQNSTKFRHYLCDICGKSYTQSSHLWQHLRFHRGVKPFACKEEGCFRKFTIRPDLNDHIRKCHTGERPYHCTVCDKRFLTGSVYYQHRLIHRGERRYGCNECGKRFYRADALKNHQRIHTGEKPYSCAFCPKSFRQRGDRDKHIRARHSNLDPNLVLAAKNIENKMKKDMNYVGNVVNPKSMFEPIMPNNNNINTNYEVQILN